MESTLRLRRQFRKDVPMLGRVGIKGQGAEFKSTKNDDRTVWGWATTTEPDEIGEVTIPEGIDTSFFPQRNKAVLLDHDKSVGVGQCRAFKIKRKGKGRGLYVQTYISTTQLGQEVYTLVKEGIIGAFSIGYVVESEGPPTSAEREEYGPGSRNMLRRIKLLEYSFVVVPMNADARIDSKIKSLAGQVSRDTLELAGWRQPVGRTTVTLDGLDLPGEAAALDIEIKADAVELPI